MNKGIVGQCCNCKREFPYSPEFCVSLICNLCASHLPKHITKSIEDGVAKRTLGLIRALVNHVDFKKSDPRGLKDVLNALLDLGDSQMPSLEKIIEKEILPYVRKEDE